MGYGQKQSFNWKGREYKIYVDLEGDTQPIHHPTLDSVMLILRNMITMPDVFKDKLVELGGVLSCSETLKWIPMDEEIVGVNYEVQKKRIEDMTLCLNESLKLFASLAEILAPIMTEDHKRLIESWYQVTQAVLRGDTLKASDDPPQESLTPPDPSQ